MANENHSLYFGASSKGRREDWSWLILMVYALWMLSREILFLIQLLCYIYSIFMLDISSFWKKSLSILEFGDVKKRSLHQDGHFMLMQKSFEFQAEVSHLMNTIINSFYSKKDFFPL